MCLIAYAWNAHPRWPLVLIGNRDELHARPASAADHQPDAPFVYGGRDLQKQGSWLQVSTRGRLAAVTNVRDGLNPEAAARSRGELVTSQVRASASNAAWLQTLAPQAHSFGRFNLLVWDGTTLMLAGNHPRYRQRVVEAGVHGLSNGDFDAPWPKVQRACSALSEWLRSAQSQINCDQRAPEHALADQAVPEMQSLFRALADERIAPDHELPDTHVGMTLERQLSSPFIRGERYGTRCSSVVLIGAREIVFAERRFRSGGEFDGESVAILPRQM